MDGCSDKLRRGKLYLRRRRAESNLAGAISDIAFGAIGKGIKAVGSAVKASKAVKYTTGTVNQIGKIGEKISGIIKNTKKFFVNEHWRIPDGITKKFVQKVTKLW